MKASIDSIETMGLVDGPGIRCVIFFNGCKLRCKYCHNPEMWQKKENNYTPQELVKKILRCKPYFGKDGGVTFSGGEPLLHSKFIIEVAKLLKKENINIALDTAGIGNNDYEEILKYIDLVILDIKHTDKNMYKIITGGNIEEQDKFIAALNKSHKPVWIRQVIVPGINDNVKYILKLKDFIKNIKNVLKVELLPYSLIGVSKYEKLGIPYRLDGVSAMNKEKCKELEKILRGEV